MQKKKLRCGPTMWFSIRFSIDLLRWGGHMIQFYNRFLINKTYSIFLFYGKKSLWRHNSHQRVDLKSEALQIFNRLQTLLSTLDLGGHTVRFRSKANRIRKSDGKSYHLSPHVKMWKKYLIVKGKMDVRILEVNRVVTGTAEIILGLSD